VDGQENPYALIESSKYQEVQKYISTTQHIYNPLMVLFSKKTWDKLSEDERRILREAAAEATAYERKVSRETNVAALEKLKPVVDKYSREIGEPLMKEMLAEVQKMRAHQRWPASDDVAIRNRERAAWAQSWTVVGLAATAGEIGSGSSSPAEEREPSSSTVISSSA
jgi:TRAP-type C4-dicarboxylate transport system substrate-binding protein